MPVMDGYELTPAVRAEESLAKSARIPIIALTANAVGDAAAFPLRAALFRLALLVRQAFKFGQ
jgi:CheY-like chemotaxis protein